MRRLKSLATTVVLLGLVACGGGQRSPSPAGERLVVVATTTVFADLVRQVGGGNVEVHSLVPAGGEVHTFDPAPSDAARLAGADLLVANGLGLDDWVLDFARATAGEELPILELGAELAEVDYIEADDDHEEEDLSSEEPGAEQRYDPHLWLDIGLAERYVDRIRLKLIEIDPARQAAYDDSAAAYGATLRALDDQTLAVFTALPAEQRRVVSFHDAFAYFARAYGLEIVGVVVAAPGQDPSPSELAALIGAIDAAGVRAILAESQFSADLAETIASETGATVVGALYTDSLGDPPLDTYVGAMSWNVDRIVEALQ